MFRRYSVIAYALLLLGLFASGCKKDAPHTYVPPKEGLSDVSTYDAELVISWMDIFRALVQSQSVNPPRASRIYAYAGLTIYESVVDGIQNNISLQGQLNGFHLNTIPVNTDSLDYGIVVNEALSLIAKCDTIFPGITLSSINTVDAVHDAFLLSKTGMVLDSIVAKSRARGMLVAKAIMQYAATDNFLTVRALPLYDVPKRDSIHPWYYEPTDAGHPNPAEPYWGQMRPFVLLTSNEVEIPQMVLFSSDTSSAFGMQAMEVYNTVNNRTADQSSIRLWWSDATGTQTPAGHWMGILKYIIRDKGYKLDKAAELYALVGITTADAFISCWDAKYKYNLLRPETYIKAYIQAGWSTGQFDVTPPFPEYPSGHSVCSGAADKVLTEVLGMVAFTDSINSDIGYAPRSFPSFDSAANEAGISRLYGGIHYREAIVNGLQQGRAVGQKVLNRIRFR